MADSGKATRGLHCDVCRGPCRIPAWITNAGGPNYQNNDAKQHLAIARAHLPVTTAGDRAAALKSFRAMSPELQALCEKIKAEADGTRRPELAHLRFVPTPFEMPEYPAIPERARGALYGGRTETRSKRRAR